MNRLGSRPLPRRSKFPLLRLGRLAMALLVATVTLAGTAVAEEPSPDERYFTDVELVTQEGQTVRLYHDLMADRVVVFSAFFTECTGVCPLMAKKLAALQREFADHMGKDLHIISMSVDPIQDSPHELAKFAQRYGAGPGWYFIGGNKTNVDLALAKLGQYVDDRETHSNLLIMGNLRTGLWKKVIGLADDAELARHLREVLNDPGMQDEETRAPGD